MHVCGVELKGGEAIICLLDHDRGAYTVSECRQRSLPVTQSASTDSIRDFQFTFSKLLQDYQVDEVVIIERHQKGKLMGSATSFKLEAAIQLLELPVTMLSTAAIKEQLNLMPPVSFDELGLKKFQQAAFNAAYAYLSPQ
jgi:hypothetical protein